MLQDQEVSGLIQALGVLTGIFNDVPRIAWTAQRCGAS
jgi:hypothetical protein